MKAWKITDTNENLVYVFHAEKSGQAISDACRDWGITWNEFFQTHRIKRCKEFDDIEFTPLKCLQTGVCGWVGCERCDNPVYGEDLNDPLLTFVASGKVYCSQKCWEKDRP
jgi:hypothetical protein